MSGSRWIGTGLLVVLVALVVVGGGVGAVGAQDSPVDDPAQRLAERYAPIVMVRAQDGACDGDGERFAPMAIDGVLDNPQVLLRQVGTGNPVIMQAPSAGALFGLGEGFYLDFPGDALEPGCIYESDYRRYTADSPAVVYAHIARQADAPGFLALQYWFFWYYNDWNNKHEGDWEGIQVLFEVGTVEEALTVDPVSVGYAQHEGGERASWGDGKLERRGTHPVVYSSVGSHASYFGSALYLGRSGSEGFGCDSTDGPSVAIEPEVVVLPDAVDAADDPLAWLAFEGRWGERQPGPFNGPTGPQLKERWVEPIAWHDLLRDSSVVVPGGDQLATEVIGAFCGVVEWGSAQLITLQQNPAVLLLAVVVLVALVSAALGRTEWSVTEPVPVVRRRRAGQIITTSWRLYRSRPTSFLAIGLGYGVVAVVTGIVVALVQLVPLVGALVDSDRELGAVGAVLAVVVGGLAHAVAFVVITAVVARFMRGLESEDEPSVREALRQTAAHLGALAAGVGRAFVIVGALSVSVVGIPWGLRQAVRYQFIAHATVVEGRRGGGALARSSELVAGRWLHTAAVLTLLNALVAGVAIGVGIVLLLVLSSLPLWLFSVVVTASSAVIVPYAAIGSVLLYGDARAEADDAEPADAYATA